MDSCVFLSCSLSLALSLRQEDFQLLLQQQVLSQQQQAEQSQKRGGLLGTLGRKTGKASARPPPSPSPSTSCLPSAATPTTLATSAPKAPVDRETPNRWRIKLRRGRTSRGPDESTPPVDNSKSQYSLQTAGGSRGSQFHTISLD